MKRKLLVSAVVAALLTGSVTLNAKDVDVTGHGTKARIESLQKHISLDQKPNENAFRKIALKDTKGRTQYCVAKEAAYQKAGFKKAPEAVFSGLNETLSAINSLQHHDIDAAKRHLAAATKAFDAALKADPKLKLVPIANEIEVKAFNGDAKLIKRALVTAEYLLSKGDTQGARELLLPLEDEMDITVEYIPMDIFPVATKEAQKALEKGDTAKALALLTTGLGTFVVDTVVIPIPLLAAQELVATASKIDKTKKKEALAYLKAAQEELEKAILLGYTRKYAAEYRALIKEIKAIEKEIKGKNAVEKLYEHLKESFKKLLGKTRGDVTRNKAEAAVNAYEKSQMQKALKKRESFYKEAVEEAKKANNK